MSEFPYRVKILCDLRSRLDGRDPQGEVSVNCADLERMLGLAAVALSEAADKNLTAVELNALAGFAFRRFKLRRKPKPVVTSTDVGATTVSTGATTGRWRSDKPNLRNRPSSR